MAIDLKTLSRPKADRPIIATLFGEGGMGKTTLAAMFPAPVFIRTEDGTASIADHPDALLFPVAQSTGDVFDAIEALATQDHDRKTVVFDSVTQYEKIAIREILDDEPNPKAKNMAAAHGGYGKAFGMLDKKHQDLREAVEWLATDKGMNVVFLAHATVEELDLPDVDKYSRYTIQLHKNRQYDCVHHYSNNVDLVAFIRLKTMLRGASGEKKRALSDGEREIICFPVASNVSKNRFGITAPIPFSFDAGNPFDQFVAK
jgi:hypothetical protein